MRSCFSYFLYVFTCVVIVVFVTNEIKEKKKKKVSFIKIRPLSSCYRCSSCELYWAAELRYKLLSES